MKKMIFSFAITWLFLISPSIQAKGPTRKVVISGSTLVRSIEIVDVVALSDFNIWSGPGTSSGGEETFIANWFPVAGPPPTLERYRVAFYANHHEDGLDYVVTYVDDPANHRGFVYVPGKGEADYSLNTFSIYRGVEGQWFAARRTWVDLATALINTGR